MSVIGHIFSTLFRAIVQILLTAVVCFIIGFAAVVAVVDVRLHHLGGPLTYTAAALVGLALAYAGGITVLLIAAVRAAFEVASGAVKDAGAAVGDVERGVGAAARTVEGKR